MSCFTRWLRYNAEMNTLSCGCFFKFGNNAVLSVLLQNTAEYFISLCDTSIITWTSILRRCFRSYLKGFTISTIPVWTVPVRQGYQTINEGCNPAGILDLPDRKRPSPRRVGTQVKELPSWEGRKSSWIAALTLKHLCCEVSNESLPLNHMSRGIT